MSVVGPAAGALNRHARRAARARARRSRGFTLVELVISLVAGLIVAMAVMGVSKEATNTFHEEVRVAGAEMGLRIAMERIRLDLGRAAFMGTGNLAGDPLVARAANYVGTSPNLSNFVGGSIPYSLQWLSGITLRPEQASVLQDANGKAQLTQAANNLQPDSIDIAGNFSSSDEYAASIVWNPPSAGACAATAAISLEMTTPAGWRIRNAETAASTTSGYKAGQALQAAFHPGASITSSFLLKLNDQSGHSQYLVSCPGGIGVSTTYSPIGTVPTAMIYLSPVSKILSTNDTGGVGGVAGFAAGWVTVSPLEIARWDIETPAQLTTQVATAVVPASYIYNQTATGAIDGSDFLLTRSYLDMSANCTSSTPCAPDPDTVEVIAEYAVDLKFGLTVDSVVNPLCTGPTAFPCPQTAPTYTGSPLLNYRMDSLTSTTNNAYTAQTAAYTGGIGPQRIRDVQVRVGVRGPFGDRAVDISMPSTSSALSNGYLLRYKLDNSALHYNAANPYARVRETTAEVGLPNQARFYW